MSFAKTTRRLNFINACYTASLDVVDLKCAPNFGEAQVFFTLFFSFRESTCIRDTISELLPFDEEQTDRLLAGIGETIIANLYGSLAVGLAQGTLTGLAFWALGLSAPVLWALVTVLASLVPLLGSALVWAPAALVLIMTGHWVKALMLFVSGAAVVGQVDVLVRP